MLRFWRLTYQYKFYKQIAEIIDMQVYKINDEITHEGPCFLYGKNRFQQKTTTVQLARIEAQEKGQDLVLLKEGFTPTLQIKPYVYEIYKNFFTVLKKPKHPKTIPLSQKIMEHDIKTKVQIAKNLFRKGHGQLKLIGQNDTEQNLSVLQLFVKELGQVGDAKYELQRVKKGKKKQDYQKWTCFYSLKQLKPHINYDNLDRRFAKMYKHNITLQDIRERNKFNQKMNKSEQQSQEQKGLNFDTRKQGQQYFYRLVGNIPQKKQNKKQKQQSSEQQDQFTSLAKMTASQMATHIEQLKSKENLSQFQKEKIKVLTNLLYRRM